MLTVEMCAVSSSGSGNDRWSTVQGTLQKKRIEDLRAKSRANANGNMGAWEHNSPRGRVTV